MAQQSSLVFGSVTALPAQPSPGNPPSGTTLLYADATTNALRALGGGFDVYNNVSYMGFRDDFLGNTTGTIAAVASFASDSWWTVDIVGGGTTGTMTNTAGTWGNPGEVTITTPASSGQGLVIYKSGNNVAPLGALGSNAGWQADFIVKLTGTANIALRIGFADNGQAKADPPTGGMWVRYDTAAADTKYTFETRAASTSTISVVNSINADTGFHHLRMRSVVAGTILFSVDNGVETALSANISANSQQPFVQVIARAAGAVSGTLDLYGFMANINRL